MTAADMIYAHIAKNGTATRPEMEALFQITEKTVDSAIRKLERLGYICRAGFAPRQGKNRQAVIFILTDAQPDARLIADCRGRPAKESGSVKPSHSFDALGAAMNSFFGRRAA
jgi:hypothetical protein